MKRPILNPIPLDSFAIKPGDLCITMDPGAWDKLLAKCYDDGWYLIVMKDGRPIKVYQKPAHEIRGKN